MKPHRRQRLAVILFILSAVGGGVTFMLLALNENINLFYSTEQILSGAAPKNKLIRAGGMVLEGSVERSVTSLEVRFLISDMRGHSVPIIYTGILPDLFREGQGVITKGMLEDSGNFVASEVLAKHDENYMPPELADMLNEKHTKNRTWSDAL
ncbi:MAG: cytochrome c maturation protein CcmE [Gammaproteobacteria bacterium]|nr:cytochrome c maturation protein CcmE [Gammaproteobacteria bacterium]